MQSLLQRTALHFGMQGFDRVTKLFLGYIQSIYSIAAREMVDKVLVFSTDFAIGAI
ncbi:MAG: hypothetical protein LH628_08185 [Microcoleus sp. CAN_BIN18]|nr:hypothetical protein [Microcoleus sp. CAN_BIN18]